MDGTVLRPGPDASPPGIGAGRARLEKDMIVGFIGSGNIGGTLARLALNAGHEAVLSNSRGPETLQGLVDGLGPGARATTPSEAAQAGEIVVVSVPLSAYRQVPSGPLQGKVVLDTNNYYPERDGHVLELDDESTTTSELLQAHLGGSFVVKVFNNISFKHLRALARPEGAPDRTVLAIAGNDVGAKHKAAQFISSIGYDTYDVGPLAEGWRYQRDTAAYAGLYSEPGEAWPGTPRRVSVEELKEKLAAARRYRDA